MASKKEVKIERGSGNVYADLGFSNPEEMHGRAELVMAIAEAIASEGLTQRQAAARAGLHQPDICRILSGKFQGYSIERLAHILNSLGRNVTIVVAKSQGDSGRTIVQHKGKRARATA
jgi:predicted XRE-type DNA-binding protein